MSFIHLIEIVEVANDIAKILLLICLIRLIILTADDTKSKEIKRRIRSFMERISFRKRKE